MRSGGYLVEDVHHGLTGKVPEVLPVLAETLKELHASQQHLRFLDRHEKKVNNASQNQSFQVEDKNSLILNQTLQKKRKQLQFSVLLDALKHKENNKIR